MWRFEVGNDKVMLRCAVGKPDPGSTGQGIQIETIYDRAAGREYLKSPTYLFEYAARLTSLHFE